MRPIYILILLIFISCNENKKEIVISEDYKKEMDAFRLDMNNGRKKGYLQLTGLFKLNSNQNTFGKAPENDFVLDIETLPNTIGQISVLKEDLSFEASPNIKVTTAKDSTITTTSLKLDEYGSSEKLFYKHINWQVITRSGDLYLRVWDLKNPAIDAFKGFKSFPLDDNYIVDATFEYYEEEKSEEIDTKLGSRIITQFIGKVSFALQGNNYTLDVGSNGFTMVRDETSSYETYGGGRYIYLDLPEKNGVLKIDFNKLYNPPCAYSEFTTCPFPPRQNMLPIRLEAGEKLEKIL